MSFRCHRYYFLLSSLPPSSLPDAVIIVLACLPQSFVDCCFKWLKRLMLPMAFAAVSNFSPPHPILRLIGVLPLSASLGWMSSSSSPPCPCEHSDRRSGGRRGGRGLGSINMMVDGGDDGLLLQRVGQQWLLWRWLENCKRDRP